MRKFYPTVKFHLLETTSKSYAVFATNISVLLSHGNQEEDRVIGFKMLFLAKQNNDLKTRIENEGIEKIKSAEWIRIDAVNISFPSLSEEEIRCLAICVYQVNLAKSYVQEHLNEQAELTVYVSNKMNKLQSRHVSSKSYLLWILYDDCNVISWYCKCRTGSRVVGMCAHVASVIWYLAYARNLDQPFCCQRLDRILKRCQKHARA